ncbi:DUF3761 domain-containing protein [Burkholderia thailandensis]|uniref:DUF3761 domain-containing protein n=1 Tax=Burkholderia thailandensis TaxID=57975 RepID=UPI003855C919
MPSGRLPHRQRQTRETMSISLPRVARRIAVALAIAALPPAPAFAYLPNAPAAGGEADLDRHDTYRNRDGETVHAPAHSKSGRVPEGRRRAAATAHTASAGTGAVRAPGTAASPRGARAAATRNAPPGRNRPGIARALGCGPLPQDRCESDARRARTRTAPSTMAVRAAQPRHRRRHAPRPLPRTESARRRRRPSRRAAA